MINLCCYNYCSGLSLGEYFLFLKACHQQKASYQTQKNIFAHIAGEIPKNIASCPIPNPSRDSAVMLSRKRKNINQMRSLYYIAKPLCRQQACSTECFYHD